MPEQNAQINAGANEETDKLDLRNADVKNHPLFIKIATQLSELQKAEAERQKEEIETARQVEIKKAQEEGRYIEILKAKEVEMDELKKTFEREKLQSDLKSELILAGFKNTVFIRGAVADYKEGDIKEYVNNLLQDDQNKIFLETQQRAAIDPPGKVTIGSSNNTMSIQRAKELEHSQDPKQREQAREFLTAYFKQHGKFPD